MKCTRKKCLINFSTDAYPTKKYCSVSCQKMDCQSRASLRLKNRIFSYFNNKCAGCGISDIRALQIDHVRGGGVKEIRGKNRYNKTSGIQYYRNVLKEINNGKYQILCANCNWIKRFTNNE